MFLKATWILFLDSSMVVSVTVVQLNWQSDWSRPFVTVTVVLLNRRCDWPGSLWIFSSFCFLSIAILSRSSQTRFVSRDVLLPLNFLESLSYFSMDFFCVFLKKLKRLCWLVVSFPIFLFLVRIAKKLIVLFYETIFTDLFDDSFFVF